MIVAKITKVIVGYNITSNQDLIWKAIINTNVLQATKIATTQNKIIVILPDLSNS